MDVGTVTLVTQRDFAPWVRVTLTLTTAAPVTGLYQFVFSAQTCRGGFNNLWYFVVNTVQQSACHVQVSGGDTVLNTCYLVASLGRGDRLWVKQMAGSCAWASATSRTISLSGSLLARDGAHAVGGRYSSCALARLDSGGTYEHSSGARPEASVLLLTPLLLLKHLHTTFI